MALFKKDGFKGRGENYDMVDNRYRDRFDLDNRKPKKQAKDDVNFAHYGILLALEAIVILVVLFIIPKFVSFFASFKYYSLSDIIFSHTTRVHYTVPFFLSWKWYLLAVVIFGIIMGLSYAFAKYRYNASKVSIDAAEINQHEDDMQIMLPEALPAEYDIFPDTGAHSNKNVTAILSHMHLSNKGLNKVEMVKRYTEDVYDESGELIHHRQDPMIDDEGYYITEMLPMIDKKLSEDLFDSSFMFAKDKRMRFDARKLIYEKVNNEETRLSKFKGKSVADEINENWSMPEYELQRPAGMYIIDTSPTNTLIAAITRGYKGQGVIEPTIDCMSRSDIKSNLIINDPKAELYVKFYYRMSIRGFEVVAFNLMNDSKTNIYNPLMYAVNAARHGEYQKTVMLVKNIGNLFFPVEGADEPMWPNAANNAFQRCALGLIEYYLEEEAQILQKSRIEKWSPLRLSRVLDQLWGHVSLYNVYQFMTVLSSKKSSDPRVLSLEPMQPDDETDELSKSKKRMASIDLLTLYFKALEKLPVNSLRRSVLDVHNSLLAMAGSDKTISSVYGIALVGLSFFTDEKIARLTSGFPSQNFDIDSLSFPRRLEVHFSKYYMDKASIRDQRFKWSIYHDNLFKDKYEGSDYEYTGIVKGSGWVDCVWKGLLDEDESYFKLEIFEVATNNLMKIFYFKFKKSYQVSSDGRTFVEHPVLKDLIVKDGSLIELKYNDATKRYEPHNLAFKRHYKDLRKCVNGKFKNLDSVVYAIDNIVCHYVECPKAVFLITPPNMFEYARIPLIIVDQVFNMSVDNAYTLAKNQKPFYGNKFMIDELGNFQSGGNGIPFLTTKVSIGLGQDQQFTLVVQVIQQFQDVYGQTSDRTLQSNLGNILFLRSNDSEMLKTFSEMSGTIHRGFTDQRSVTKDNLNIINTVGTSISDTLSLQEQHVITINDMLSIPRCNMIVFGHASAIWSRNETVLPVAWRLHQLRPHDTEIVTYDDSGRMSEYTLFEVPSISNTNDFNRLGMIPDFYEILAKRLAQARWTDIITENFKKAYNCSSLNHLDLDETASELMLNLRNLKVVDTEQAEIYNVLQGNLGDDAVEDNSEALNTAEVKRAKVAHDMNNVLIFCDVNFGNLSQYAEGVSPSDVTKRSLSLAIYDLSHSSFGNSQLKRAANGDICFARDDAQVFFVNTNSKEYSAQERKEHTQMAQDINSKAKGSKVTGAEIVGAKDKGTLFEVQPEFWRFLADNLKSYIDTDGDNKMLNSALSTLLGDSFMTKLTAIYTRESNNTNYDN